MSLLVILTLLAVFFEWKEGKSVGGIIYVFVLLAILPLLAGFSRVGRKINILALLALLTGFVREGGKSNVLTFWT